MWRDRFGVIMKNDGANRIPHISDEHFAPDAIDAIYQVVRSLHLKRANKTVEVFFVESDVLRRKAESSMQMWGSFPAEFVSALRMKNSSLSKTRKSPCWPVFKAI